MIYNINLKDNRINGQFLKDGDIVIFKNNSWINYNLIDLINQSVTIPSLTSSSIISALGYTPYDNTNPAGYVNSSALSGYATQTWVNGQGFLTSVPAQSFASLTGKPTTLVGYGITDASPLLHTHSISDITGLSTALSGKQSTITTGTNLQYLRGDLSLATFPTNISQFNNDSAYITSSALSGYVPYSGATGNVNLGINNSFTAGAITVDGTASGYSYLTLKGNAGNNIHLRNAMSTAGGMFAVQDGAFNFLLTARSDGGISLHKNTAVGFSVQYPSATLHVRGASATTGSALLVENSTPTTLFSVSNAGLSTFNPAGASGDAIEVTNGGYIKYGTVRFRGSGSGFFFYDSAFASFFSTTTTLTTSKSPIIQTGFTYGNIGSGFGGAYFTVRNTFSAILGGYLHGIEVKNTYNPSNGVGGIFRDIYIAPVSLGVNVQDWRGIEIVSPSTTVTTLVKLNNGTTDIFCVKGDTTKGKVSFFGATPATQQTLGAATAGASYTATEQAMIQKAYDLLRAFGLGT